jgi:HSP20 family molecular chaperone IbpA
MEIEIDPFERRIRLRVPVDMSGIQAVYKEGFLTVRLPKAQENKRGVHVDVVTS